MNWYQKYIKFQSTCLIRTELEDKSIVERVIEGHKSVLEPLYLKYKPHQILVIGMGEGQELEALNRIGSLECDIYGGTLIKSDIDLCNIYFNNKFKNISFQDIHKMKYENNFFDLVISKHTIEHCPAPYIAFCEINRVLKNDGILFLEIPIEQQDKVNPFEAKYVENTHIFNFHHIMCLYPSQVLNLGLKTGFELLDYYQGGGGYDYIFKKKHFLI